MIDLYHPTRHTPKSATQWEASLLDYAYPALGEMCVDKIGSGE